MPLSVSIYLRRLAGAVAEEVCWVEWAGCASSLSVRVHNCHAVLGSHMSAWMGDEEDGLN